MSRRTPGEKLDVRRLLGTSKVSAKKQILIGGTVVALTVAGAGAYVLTRGTDTSVSSACGGGAILYWHDPMVPMERYPGPGKSSMNMDLTPKCANEAEGGVRVSPAMVQNLGVRTAQARVMDLAPSVRAVGRVELDERLITEVQTLTSGFVESLSVRAEGEPISQGARVATVYSPELYAAQLEYKAVLRSARQVTLGNIRQASRTRLRLLGLPEAMVRRLERGGAPQRTYPVFAPTSGVVTQIGARPGAQVQLGQSIVTISGLSRVAVIAEVPETSLGNVQQGLPVEVSFAAFPGEVRRGSIDYVFPRLEPQSRTARVRVTLDNPGRRLLAGMFANITIMGTGGMALAVPSEAVIDTGRRKVVLVRRNGAFLPREVVTGREAQDWTEIVTGIEPGAEVVVSGQFLIDSEASLTGVTERLNANAPPAGAAQQLPVATGTVQSIDLPQGRVTIAHGPVPMLNWPPMTMTFSMRNPGALRGLQRGMRVQFEFQAQGDSFMIERISRAPEQ
ncbi:MAG: efflux RND transporter periplasmic adaptor subunit [Pseudomonadota bacterium]|nr:efflux RND transporter periplasmic adaptor subunit [Pseudomonadota bacterium]